MADNKHIVLGVTGSIAAYKAAELVRLMIKKNREVSVVMTQAATRFVGELTFRTLTRRPVVLDMFQETETWRPTHISLADWADVLVIAPCTANVMAKLAHGLADDALTATALACAAPLVVAPAMNEKMWIHPATQENVRILKARGAVIVDVEQGELACGYEGRGRLASLETILKAVERRLKS
ncbi:MAG: phosphopantothenoylcysteine decarboxylase [Kiritimatiellae bacterium]|nr:phosphopantothenoylcysteine decarboxylase [Verrucomicrobiota bacterium]MBU4366056.1 phosphopantothenoylcysteine decarboxylase [Verrucomicrobiota bacterium]MCG2661862.1 phosphopantothenoylcysteine decarboxylase [Kiritimatiellia bacterium]